MKYLGPLAIIGLFLTHTIFPHDHGSCIGVGGMTIGASVGFIGAWLQTIRAKIKHR